MDSPVRSSRSSSSESKTSATYSSSSPNTRSKRQSSDDSSSLDHQTRHKHNDYSCYIHVINKTGLDLELVDSKAKSGRWAVGSPAPLIEAHTDTLIELTDPKGPYGSEGWCVYRLHHPQKYNAVTFKLKFGDPYWRGDDNFLRATTQYPKYVSSNVLQYPTRGHPFVAYVEVGILENKDLDRRISQKTVATMASEATTASGDSETFDANVPLKAVPGHLSSPGDRTDLDKGPIAVVQIIDINNDSDDSTHARREDAVASIHNSADDEEHDDELVEPAEHDTTLEEDEEMSREKLDQRSKTSGEILKQESEQTLEDGVEKVVDEDLHGSQKVISERKLETIAEDRSNEASEDPLGRLIKDETDEAPEQTLQKNVEETSAYLPEEDPESMTNPEENVEEQVKEGQVEAEDAVEVQEEGLENNIQDFAHDVEPAPSTSTKSDVKPQVESKLDSELEPESQGACSTDIKERRVNLLENVPAIVSEPAFVAESSRWTWIIQPHHAKLGIVAMVFLASYGFTAARVSGGLFFGLGRFRR